ncbi:helix-turn-helix domain-containing protein [Clostridium coskatii]|uniref:helix-turn-helix domain-containing protein n=1 Tax=Clostridium coskatii TaxID=1705578 RepID=UPI0007BEB9FA|nr:helix-turn-helix transcriptional regulator [Clostridium coskatii]
MNGEKIKNIRLFKRLGLNETAKKAGISGSYLSNIEKGIKTNPSTETLQKIADALGVSVNEFFDSENISNDNINNTKPELNKRDLRDIAKDVDSIMDKLDKKEDGPTYYNDIEMKEDDKELFRSALELALKTIKVKNKEKYTPKKYRK